MLKSKNIILFLLMLSFLQFHSAFAQSPSIEALYKKYNERLHDSVKLKIYRDLSVQYTSVDIPIKINYSRKYKKLAEKLNKPKNVIDADIDIGMAYVLTDVKDSAVFYFTKAIESAKNIEEYELAGRAALNLGYVYERVSAFNFAVEKYNEALLFFKKVDYSRGLGQTYTNIGSIYFDNGLYELAKDYFTQGLEQNIRSKDNSVIASSYFALGSTNLRLGKYDLARHYYDKSMQLRVANNDYSGIALSKWGLSELEYINKNYSKSYQLSEEAYLYFKKMNNQLSVATILYTVSNAALKLGNVSKAKDYANELSHLGEVLKSNRIKVSAYNVFSEIYIAENNYKKASEYLKLTNKYKDSVDLENTIKNVFLTDLNRVKDETKALLVEQEVIKNKNNEYFKIIIISLISLVLLILMALLLVKKNAEAKQINQILHDKNDEIFKTNELNLKINEELDRHNKVKNSLMSIISHDVRTPLSNLNLLLEMYRNKELSQEGFNDLLQQIEGNVFETRAFIDNILEWTKSQFEGIKVNPENFQLKDIVDSNFKLMRFQIENKKITFENLISSSEMVYGDKNMIDVMVRNLLSNSVKFCSNGDVISVKAHQTDEHIELLITDTGNGIDPNKVAHLFEISNDKSVGTSGEIGYKLGLVLCKNMLDLNQGSIRVESTLGLGTKFYVTLPKQKSV